MTNVLILMTTDRFSSPARLVVQTIEYSDHQRFSLTIGCTWQRAGQTSEFFEEMRRRGIALEILPQKHSLDPTPVLSAIRLVRKKKIDLIETHGYKACFIGLFLKILTRKPWVVVLHGHTAENRKVMLFAWLELRFSRYADRIVAVSSEMRRRLVADGLPSRELVTINNAIDPLQFASSSEAPTRAQFGIAASDFLVGVVGRFSPEKGQDLFVEAFKHLAAVHSSVKAILIGEGPTEEAIRDLVRRYGLGDRVLFAGYQPCISLFYPILDLVVLPSRSEGMPSVALEALFFRIPVVATEVGGTGEVIVSEQTGLLVPPEDPNLLSEAIVRLHGDSALRNRLAAAGHEMVRERFMPGTRVRAFEDLYGSLVANG